jgi:hypothetical protein
MFAVRDILIFAVVAGAMAAVVAGLAAIVLDLFVL